MKTQTRTKSKAFPINIRTARVRGHQLMTAEILKKLPAIGATEAVADMDKVVGVKYFHPRTNWTWYAVEAELCGEGDGGEEDDIQFFGFVSGHVGEWGMFTLKELDSIGDNDGLVPVERELYPTYRTLGEYLEKKR